MDNPQFVERPETRGIQFTASGALLQVAFEAGPRGARIHAMSASQNDTSSALLSMYRARVLTDNSLPSVGWRRNRTSVALTPVLALTNVTNSTITRTNGSFKQDGWTTGMLLGVIGSVDNPLNQVLAPLHALTSDTTLTFNGTVFNAAAASPSPMMQLVQADLLWSVALVSGCGNSNSVPAVNLLSTTNFPSLISAPDTFLTLDPYELLLVSLATAPNTDKQIMVSTFGGVY